jgi:hypothetical protein
MTEHNAQRLLIAWFRANYPDLATLFFAIPNGGLRNPVTGKRLKDEGALAGVPDLLLAIPRGPWHGLFLELKTRHGRVQPAQRAMLAALSGQGYRAVACHGWEAARDAIQEYLTEQAT